MAYESPIRLITELENKIIEDQMEGIYKAVISYQIDISKDELFKLLYGDRKQYDKGYSDGRADAIKHGRWKKWEGDVLTCSNCKHYWIQSGDQYDFNYCPNCGARMDEIGEDKSHPFAESVMMGMDGGENER